MLSRSIALLALLAVTSVYVGLIYARPSRSEQPGLEADYCYPTRSAAVAAFAKGQTVIVEGQMTLERSGTVEVFEILGRSGDKAAVLRAKTKVERASSFKDALSGRRCLLKQTSSGGALPVNARPATKRPKPN